MTDTVKVINEANITLGTSVRVEKGNERKAALHIVLEIIKTSAAAGAHVNHINEQLTKELTALVDAVEEEIKKVSHEPVKIKY